MAAFKKIKRIDDLKQILNWDSFSGKMLDSKSYPKLNFNITPNDLNFIRSKMSKKDPSQFDQKKLITPLERFMYAVLWEQGDLKKLKHIINGIEYSLDRTFYPEKGFVFNQFGKYLGNKKEPLIDQNVLRAFKFFNNDDLSVVKTIEKNSLTQEYKEWLKENSFKSQKSVVLFG